MDVFLVEPNEGIRKRLVELLSEIPNFTLAGEAGNVESAIRGITQNHPDVVVMNLTLEKGNGLEVLKAVRLLEPAPRVILMSDFGDGEVADICQEAGAEHCLYQENRFEELFDLLGSPKPGDAPNSRN